MNEVNLKADVKVIADHRNQLSNIGKLHGRKIFRVSKEVVDREFVKKQLEVENGDKLALLTNRPLQRYKVIGIDVTSVCTHKNAEGSTNVYINEGEKITLPDGTQKSVEVVIPINASKNPLNKVSDETMYKALNGDNSVIFGSPDDVIEYQNRLNNNELVRLDALIADLQRQRQSLQTTIDRNIKIGQDYKRELSIDSSTTTVTVIEA